MPKSTYKIQGFHGGINSNSDPRDIQDIESPSLADVNIDKVGKITLLGTAVDSVTDLDHNITIVANRGLFVMESDRKLDGSLSTESIIFNYNSADTNIDGVDSSGTFVGDLMNFGGVITPNYYSADGALRVGDIGLAQNGRFFGYVEDDRFNSINSDSGTIGWYDSTQYIEAPTSGNSLISTPAAGSDVATGSSRGLNSADSELIGTYVNGSDQGAEIELLDVAAVNLRTGIQYNTALENNPANWNTKTNCTANATTANPIFLFENTNTLVTGASSTSNNTVADTDGDSFVVDESTSFVFGLWFTGAEFAKISGVQVTIFNGSDEWILYKFTSEEMVGGQEWNIFSCSTSHIQSQNASFGDTFTKWYIKVSQKDGNGSNDSPDYYISGPVIAKTDLLTAFPAGYYSFWHSYLYDDAKQESLLKQFLGEGSAYTYPNLNIVGTPLLFNFDIYINPFSARQFTTGAGVEVAANTVTKSSHGLIDGDAVKLEGLKLVTGGIANNTLYYVVTSTTNTFQLALTKGGAVIDITGADDTLVTGTAQSGSSSTIVLAAATDESDDAFNGYVIYISAGTGAGQYRVISNYTGANDTVDVSQNWDTNPASDSVYMIGVTFQKYALNKRIIGTRLYYKLQANDNHFLIGEVDFKEKGFKWFPESDTFAYDLENTSNTVVPVLNNTSIVKSILPDSANNVDTFKAINGFSNETKYINARYKTAVVHGRRAYIGNIKRPNAKRYPDRIVKSLVNKFDVFPENVNSIDVAINDGESIIKLETFADRILQFKQNSLYVINVSENIDFLEDTFRNKGCSFDYHVVKTDFGIAWFNSFGVYFYDGKQVTNLLEKNGMRLISESDWEAFITASDTDMSEAHIGYIPKKRQLLIKRFHATVADVFIYDFVLRAWQKGIGSIVVQTNMTNFALKDEDLIYLTHTDSVIKKWNPDPAASDTFVYETKDIDFGEPGVRKKIYKVYLSFKGNAANVQVHYGVDGLAPALTFNNITSGTDGSSTGSGSADKCIAFDAGTTDWLKAELKPSASINNKSSFRLKVSGDGSSDIALDFEINDISIIYRMKSIR